MCALAPSVGDTLIQHDDERQVQTKRERERKCVSKCGFERGCVLDSAEGMESVRR